MATSIESEKLPEMEMVIPKGMKMQTRNVLLAYSFMIPALISLLLFVFIPILFSFIMSLFQNPEISQLADHLVEFFTDFGNLNRQSLYGFITDDTFGIFADRGIYLTVLGAVFLWYVIFSYKKFAKIGKVSTPIAALLAILTGLAVAPLFLFTFKLLAFDFIILPVENYRLVLTRTQLDFLKVLFNTIFWTVVCTVSHVVLGMFLAVLLNRDFKGKGFFRGIFILPWAIPSFASTVIWKNFIFHPDGFLGSRTDAIFIDGNFFFNTGNLVSLIIGALIVAAVFFLLNFLVSKKMKIHPSFNALVKMILLIIAIPIGIVVYEALNNVLGNLSSGAMAYDIISIGDTTMESFWVSASVVILNRPFRMITFSAILINVWLGVPFMMVSFLAAMQSIPKDLYEAAEIDGASKWDQFKKITFPLLIPTLFTVSLLGFVWTFNLFNVVYILAQNQNLQSPTDYTIFVTFIYDLFDRQHQYAQAAALSFIVFLMLILFSRTYRRIFDVNKMFVGEEEEKTEQEMKRRNRRRRGRIRTHNKKKKTKKGGNQT